MTRTISWRAKATAWRLLVPSLAGGFILCATPSTAGESHWGEKRYRYYDLISGTAAPSSFDYNQDMVPGHYIVFSGKSNLGAVHGAFLVEYDLASLASPILDPACPAELPVKLPVVVSTGTRALTGTDGQVYMQDDAASALYCLDAQGAFILHVKGEVIGGTGKFAGATGTYEYTGSGNILLQDNYGIGLPFGGFALRTRGTIVVHAH